MAAHASRAPSGAGRWGPGRCPASVHLTTMFPEQEDSPAAKEGTAAHEVLEKMLRAEEVKAGDIASNGVPISAEMIDGAAMATAKIREAEAASAGGRVSVELYVRMQQIHADCWGTADAVLFDPGRKAVTVFDYKFGFRHVDAFENWQLICYSVGAMNELGVPEEEWGAYEITNVVIQPRSFRRKSGPSQEWRYSGEKLVEYRKALTQAAAETDEPHPVARVGDWCLYCPAAHACEALQAAAFTGLDVAERCAASELPPHSLGLELHLIARAEAILEARRRALEEQALAFMREGHDVPFWRVDYTTPREQWAVPPEEVLALGEMFGTDLRSPKPAVVTPNQARKKGIDPAVIACYTQRPAGTMVLKPFDETIARRAFEK